MFTTVDLRTNEIGDEQIQCLANALQHNKVDYTHSLFLYLYHSIQTLQTLNLDINKIGDVGSQYLANILKKTQVK
jgi:hypothetical protein